MLLIMCAIFGDTEAAKRRLEELKDFPHLANGEIIKKLMKINESFGKKGKELEKI